MYSFSKVLVTVYCDIDWETNQPISQVKSRQFCFLLHKERSRRSWHWEITGTKHLVLLSNVLIQWRTGPSLIGQISHVLFLWKCSYIQANWRCDELVKCTMWLSEHLKQISLVLNEGKSSLNYWFPEEIAKMSTERECFIGIFTAWLSLK